VGGLKPPLLMPPGNPDSLPTDKVTDDANPLSGVTVTVNVFAWPGATVWDDGVMSMSKSALGGRTVILRVGGLGSELPAASTTVIDTVYSPGALKMTEPGVCAGEPSREPPGNTQE